MKHPFLPIARKFFYSDMWKHPREFSEAEAWLDMLSLAAFETEARCCNGETVTLDPGELVGSVRFLAARWAWSKNRVARYLVTHQKSNRIAFRDTNGTATGTPIRVIRLCKWGLYNTAGPPGGTASGTQTGTPAGQHWDKRKEGDEKPERKELQESEQCARGRYAEQPSESEVLAHAQRIGLAEWRARDWFDEMEGCGWVDYQRRPVQHWQSVLNRVRTKWEADGRPTGPPSRRKPGEQAEATNTVAKSILAQKELERIEKRIEHVRNGYDSHQSFSEQDRREIAKLYLRRKELKKSLGFSV